MDSNGASAGHTNKADPRKACLSHHPHLAPPLNVHYNSLKNKPASIFPLKQYCKGWIEAQIYPSAYSTEEASVMWWKYHFIV